MTTDNERALFEAWLDDAEVAFDDSLPVMATRDAVWLAWQARAALQPPDRPAEASDEHILSRLGKRILPIHGGRGDPLRDHWNLTEGDSLLHRDAITEICNRVSVTAAPDPHTQAHEAEPIVACVVELDDGISYLCWKDVAEQSYADRPKRALVYAAAPTNKEDHG